VFSITLHFYPICFSKYCCPFPCIDGPNEKNFKILQNRIIKFWGVSIVLEVFGDGPIKPSSCPKKRKNLGCTPILMQNKIYHNVLYNKYPILTMVELVHVGDQQF
jgi:hypothetical protein